MELIDKQKAKQALVDLPPELDALTVQKSIEAIGRVKSEEDIASVGHGFWKVNGINPYNGTIGNFHCSICEGVSLNDSNYCPNCGAKMNVENSADNVEKG